MFSGKKVFLFFFMCKNLYQQLSKVIQTSIYTVLIPKERKLPFEASCTSFIHSRKQNTLTVCVRDLCKPVIKIFYCNKQKHCQL